jgi:hypothetical protein
VKAAIINAWGCVSRKEYIDALSFLTDAKVYLKGEVLPDPESGREKKLLRFFKLPAQTWGLLLNPIFRRDKSNPSEPHTVSESKPERKLMKKAILTIVLGVSAGVGSHFATPHMTGPTTLDRGEFSLVSQCGQCDLIRQSEVGVCTECGSEDAKSIVAAPLTHPRLWVFGQVHDGWQFKDGSTQFESNGEFIVPELQVTTGLTRF